MRYVARLAALTCVLALGATAAHAGERRIHFDIPAGDLTGALQRFGRLAGVEVAIDPSLVGGRRAGAVAGDMTPDNALRLLLKGSGLTFRRSASGVVTLAAASQPELASAPGRSPETDAAIAELLVVGRRLLNVDIKRSADDIQPYQVMSRDTLDRDQPLNLEDVLRRQLTANAEVMALRQAPIVNNASPRSQIDLGGLGSARTLVLVDGRRLPSVPGLDVFLQSDINALPLSSIERIESLTSTAGGIYGPGAVGGVLNVVLRRDYQGGEVTAGGGLSDRGDGLHWRGEAAFGRTSADGATRLSITLGHSEDEGLLTRQRKDIVAALAAQNAKAFGVNLRIPPGATVNVSNSGGDGFLPPFGDAGTVTVRSHLSAAEVLARAQAITALVANAGTFDTSLSDDGSGLRQSLLTRTRSNSVLASIRHSFTPTFDAFVDYAYLDDRGRADGPFISNPLITLARGQNGNPVDGPLTVSFPTPGRTALTSNTVVVHHLVLGGILDLPNHWTGEADISLGRGLARSVVPGPGSAEDFLTRTNVDLFAGMDALKAALAAYDGPTPTRQTFIDNMAGLSVRAAGPLRDGPAGAATLTVLAEARRDHDPDETATSANLGTGVTDANSVGSQREDVLSGYAELRAPLVAGDSDLKALRGLELQLAGRVDRYDLSAPAPGYFAGGANSKVRSRHLTSAITLGARVRPIRDVMLRASLATGYLPPAATQIIPGRITYQILSILQDPRRNGEPGSAKTPFTVLFNGSPDVKSERARTMSAGLVVTPDALPGLRLSVDYTRIEITRGLANFADGDPNYILAHEDLYGDRVVRQALTDADRAKGYTGGVLTLVDASPLNIGRSISQSIDVDAAYRWQGAFGTLQIFNRLTWRPSVKRRADPELGYYNTVGRLDGPLAFRGVGGIDWSSGPWSASMSVQVYSGYKVTQGANTLIARFSNQVNLYLQGAKPVPPQAYVDLSVSRIFGGDGGLEVRAGVKNVLDHRPPTVLIPVVPNYGSIDRGIGYSPYGDARGRRFDVLMTRRF